VIRRRLLLTLLLCALTGFSGPVGCDSPTASEGRCTQGSPDEMKCNDIIPCCSGECDGGGGCRDFSWYDDGPILRGMTTDPLIPPPSRTPSVNWR